ncbi:ATP-binding protein [Streptomyces sp. NPDC049541]|uniref:ATP-binding protein n=1 Tax=Streptomyces sp. NPDC049541 TaxID=3365594 RepID=UPI00378ED633
MNQETAAPTAQPATPIRNFSVLLSPTPRGARLARLLATEQLRSWGLLLDPAVHIVAELAANAATHGRVPGRDFRLVLYVVADTLRIEVTDTRGDRFPQAQRACNDAESGRGLILVDALADRWGTALGPRPRKTVWAELNLHRTSETRTPVTRALSPKNHDGEKTHTKPHPSSRRGRAPHPPG